MPQKKSGKVLVLFLIIAAILMGTLAAIAVFFFQLETGERKAAEEKVEQFASQGVEFKKKIDDLKKAVFLLEEKNKEADERINSLLDELDLQEGLREEMKNETASLREKIEKEAAAKDKMRQQITQMEVDYAHKTGTLEGSLKQEQDKYKLLQDKYNEMLKNGGAAKSEVSAPATSQKTVKGEVINVDTESQFIIINIGQEKGIVNGQVLSVHRNKEYIGDIKISRVQQGMSAADPVAPLTAATIQKSDQVIVK